MHRNIDLIFDNQAADEWRDDRDNVSQEVGDAHQAGAEIRRQVDMHQLEIKRYKIKSYK